MVIESLLNHSNRLIVDSLKKHNVDLPSVRTKGRMRDHIKRQLDIGIIDIDRIVAALIELEGWGRQQIYLYEWNGGQAMKGQWLNRVWVERHFQDLGLDDVFNSQRPISAADETNLFTISYPQNSQKIRFVWVQNRSKLKRTEEEDPVPPAFEISPERTHWQRRILHAYLEMVVRDVTTFEWDIVSGEAMLMIRKFKGTDNIAVRDNIEAELDDVLPIEDFSRVRMSKVINNLDDIEDVIRPRVDYRPLSNPNIRMTIAGGFTDDVLSDPKIQQIRHEHRDDFNGYGGFSKWKIDNKKYVGIDLYAKKEHDHRIGIRSEELEKDVRRVLQRIRANS